MGEIYSVIFCAIRSKTSQIIKKIMPKGGTGDRSVSYPFFSGYERDEAFPQDTDLSPVLLSITISVGGEVPRLI